MLLVMGCSQSPALFQHELTPPPSPWLGVPIENNDDKFTFAIFTDLNGGEREGIFNVAVEQLNQFRPDFIMSVGDLISGGKDDKEELLKEWDSFEARAAKAGAPIFRVGGNHDLSNITMRKMWAERYGPRYYYFIYRDILFLILDSQDYSEERLQKSFNASKEEYKQMIETPLGAISPDQSAYFEEVLSTNPDVKWTFVFMHKPSYLREGPLGLTRIETALEGRPYTVFNGHVHALSHRVRKGMDYMMLGTTGGVQNPDKDNAFDHLTLVTMDKNGPNISHIRMDGLLDKTGNIPQDGNDLCFQNSLCGPQEKLKK